ncbi:MAG TPA: tetratricopeptide repeat protein [Candidatus Tenderia sp.]|nr:tetratricopeptide repeat protein [Candidatus Tenderia sp.]
MRSGFKTLTIYMAMLLGLFLLSGCASSPASRDEAKAEVLKPQPPELKLPDVELTADLLNKVLLAEVAVQRAQYAVAVELYRDLAVETRDPRLAEHATRVALFARDMAVAKETGEIWLELSPTNLDARQIMTALYVKSGEYDRALGLLDGLLDEAAAGDQDRYMLILRLLGREQDKEGARILMEKFLERHPDDVAGLYAYAQLALRDGKTEEADKASEHLLELKPDWSSAVVLRTRILQATNRGDEALAYLGGVVKRKGDDNDLRAVLGRMLLDAGDYKAAQVQFEHILKSDPDKVDVLFLAAGVASQLKDFDRAKAHFLHLNQLGERQDESAFFLGDIEEREGHFDQAIGWYDQVRQGNNYLDARGRSALLMARMGDLDGARAHLSAVVPRNDVQRLKLFLIEGEVLRETKHYQEAFDLYTQGLEVLPGNTALLYARAMVADVLGRLDVLEQDLQAILEQQPDHVEALNALGYVLADRTHRFKEAEAYIKRALELRPEAAHILDSYGWVKYRQGQFDEAVKYLRQALERNFDPEIAAHLGEVLWVKGDRNEARTVWDEALKKRPESPVILDLRRRLDR